MSLGEKVLIVEDDQIVQMHLRALVRELGYEVCGAAGSAEEALACASVQAPNLVLMDVRLPGERDGIDLARELHARYDAAIVFVTAYADEETVARAEDVGALGYVVKPFSKPQLRAVLSTALREQRRAHSARDSEERLTTQLADLGVRSPAVSAPSAGSARAQHARFSRRPFGAGSRLALYSHDTLGLGHLQRSLNVARTLTTRFPGLSILLLSGSPVAQRYALPAGVDIIKLPAVRKVGADRYAARSLAVSDEGVLRLRSAVILRALQDYDPHVLLVDHAPVGMRGELRPALEWLRERRPDCVRMVGLRDVIDDPAAVVASWRKHGVFDVLRTHYQHVLIYGQREVFDPVQEYGFPPEIRAKTVFLNYVGELDPSADAGTLPPMTSGERPLVVVTVGGGDAGEQILDPYLEMLRTSAPTFDSILLTGPLIAPDALARFRTEVRSLPGTTLLDFVSSTSPYLQRADLVVCSGGYNTVTQTLRFGKRMLLIPRVLFRAEQSIRARRLAELGLATLLESSEVTPQRLRENIASLLAEPRQPLVEARARGQVRFDGAERLAELCAQLEVAAADPEPDPCWSTGSQ